MLLLGMALSAAAVQTEHERPLRPILLSQGFTGELQGKVGLVRLGQLNCARRKLDVIFYRWEESSSPGLAIHAQQRILFIGQDQYIGSFTVDDRPKHLNGTSVHFGYPAGTGSEVRCGKQGLPKSVFLNGERRDLEK